MYLRAEQRYQAETAAARLTEILTATVPTVYGETIGAVPSIDPVADGASADGWRTTTTVAVTADAVIQTAPVVSNTIAPASTTIAPAGEAALAPAQTAIAPARDYLAPAGPRLAPARDSVAPTRDALAPASRSIAPTSDAPAPAPTPTSAARSANLASTVAALVAWTTKTGVASVRANPAYRRALQSLSLRVNPASRRALQSLVPASVLGVIAIAALIGLAGTIWPARSADGPPPGADKAQGTTAIQAAGLVPGIDGAGTASAPSPRRPAVAEEARQAGPGEQAPPAAVVKPSRQAGLAQARRTNTREPAVRPAAVTPVHTASEAQLRVTSNPPGARVTVNGIGWGQTPLTIGHLPLGTKTIRLTRDGYASEQRVVDLSADASSAVHIALRRAE
jgi:hypothetical protein